MLQWIKGCLLFSIFSSVILMLCPNKSYYKHISLVVGLLFVLVMIRPLANWNGKNISYYTDYVRRVIFSEQMNRDVEKEYMKSYSDYLKKQIERYLKEKDYQIQVRRIGIDENGMLRKLVVHVDLEGKSLADAENALIQIAGQDVDIIYE